ncbi:Hypothetical predicted protein [Paramuricea clavata]|uniref:Uncharacterized protein n=1 Tax=Paramuricea clavata TaxID=317549 RepID=A0A7D9HGH0_PARCT|nr:Hypothetical predicted protein [Paramuricea clavata]
MNLTLVLLFILTGTILAKQSSKRKQRMAVIRQAYYSNLFRFTYDLSRKVLETKNKLEEEIPEKLKLRHDKFYRKTRTAFQPQEQNEMERLNRQANELNSFVHRIKLAKSAEQNIKGDNLSLELMSIEVKLGILRMLLHRLMRKSHIRTKTKVQPTISTVKNNKLQTLTTLKDLQTSLAFMILEFGKAKKPLNQKVASGN